MSLRLSQLLLECRKALEAAGIAQAGTDARLLVAGLLDLSLTELVLNGDRPVSAEEREGVIQAVARRALREPVHRILGARDFHGIRLMLSADTLEPRPDTEVLVDAILPHAVSFAAKNGSVRLLDLGTGTGAIALALLAEVEQMTAVGVDLSAGALETARRNAQLNDVGARFETLESRWFDRVDGRFDIIVSNPPYIKSDVIPELDPDVRDFDPVLALDGGLDGLDAYRVLARDASAHLHSDGIIGLEIGYDQKHAVSDLFFSHGYLLVDACSDLGGQDRALVFAKKNDGLAVG